MITPEQEQALAVARELVRSGVPVFLGRPDPAEPVGFKLPRGWQEAKPQESVVDAWRPGWALCAVTGHGLDLVDVDPRSGGTTEGVPMPNVYLVAETPSGGTHFFVKSLGVPSRDGIFPGVDLKSGTPDGSGCGFAFIAPTVRRSKVDGLDRAYRWVGDTSAQTFARYAADDSGGPLRSRVHELRVTQAGAEQPRRIARSAAAREFDTAWNKLVVNLGHWARTGWGGEAHAGLLAATTHLARLAPEHAEHAYAQAFKAAGLEADAADLAKLESALARVVPDVVVPDEQLSPAERFLAGGESSVPLPSASTAVSQAVDAGVFDFVTPERARRRMPPASARFGAFGGSTPLVYPEGVHWLQGESESGKTWVGLEVVRDALASGTTVIMVDYEDTEGPVFERLEQLGTTDDQFRRLVYVDGQAVSFTELTAHLRDGGRDYGLLLVDGVTAALSSAGLSGRNEQEVTAWADSLLRLVRCSVCIDHVVKDIENRNGAAIGSQAKKSVVTGTAIEVVATQKFGRGQGGIIELRIQKDKKGGVRGALGPKKKVTVRFSSDILTGAVRIAVPEAHKVDIGTETIPVPQDKGAEAWAVVMRLEAFPGAHAGQSMRTLRGIIKDEMGLAGRNGEWTDDAIRMFKARAGTPGIEAPEWLRLYEMSLNASAGLAIG